MLADAALVGNAMKLAYLGERIGAKAPPVFQAWISDRDPIKQTVPTTDVRVLLTKGQLSDLNDIMKKIVDAANQGLISPTEMFNQLRNVAATMGPTRTSCRSRTRSWPRWVSWPSTWKACPTIARC